MTRYINLTVNVVYPYVHTDCPNDKFQNVEIHWHGFQPRYLRHDKNGTAGFVRDAVNEAKKICCKHLNYSFHQININMAEYGTGFMVASGDAKNDTIRLLYPTLANVDTEKLFGAFQFVPVTVSPGPMLLGLEDSSSLANSTMRNLVTLWWNPMLLFIIAMCAVAGVSFWILEFHNSDQMSHLSMLKKFVCEVGNSVWFSVVTLTTVGYGDIVPQSKIGRVFAVLWMFVGQILITLFTAHVSSALTTYQITKGTDFLGEKIGVMPGTGIYFGEHLNYGAVYVEYNTTNILDVLLRGEVSRLLLPNFQDAAYVFSRQKYDKSDRLFATNIEQPFAIGMAVMNTEDLPKQFLQCWSVAFRSFNHKNNRDQISKINKDEMPITIGIMTDNILSRVALGTVLISIHLFIFGVVKNFAVDKFKRWYLPRKTHSNA